MRLARPHWRQLSIGMRLMVAIAAILVAAWAVMIAWAAAEQRASVIRQAESLAQSVHQMTMANLLFMKVTKTIKKRSLYYEQVYQSEAIRDLRVLRGDPVVAEMGEGDAVSMSPDALEKQALTDGKEILVETDDPEHGHTLRAVFPVRASTNYLGKNCLDGSCHTEPKEGDILGAVSMKIALAKVDGDIQHGKMRLILAATLISIPFLGFILFFIRRVVSRPLGAMTTSLKEIAHGESQGFQRLPIAGQDEIGQAAGAFNLLMGKLEDDAKVTAREHTEMTRIKFALDSVSVPVTVQDDRQHLIYMNKRAEQLWSVMEPGLQQRHPTFSVAGMANQPIARVFNQAEHQALFAGKLTQPAIINAELAHHQLMVSASPVHDNQGTYIGSVAQWADRTEEIAIEQEVERIVGAAARGDFSQRLATNDKDGFFLRLAQGLNQFLETSAQGLGALAQVLNALSRGDLTGQIEQDFAGTFGQLRDDTNLTVTQLRDVVNRIKRASETINNTASQIATGNHDLAERTREQTQRLAEASGAMDELGRLVRHNAENAEKARELAAGSNEQVQQGGEIVRRVVQTMGEIEHSSKRITEIVGMIDSIAFQTNILALNAAVEAARAGEQGRGFAVVAAEVRNLALRSAGAAKEIHALIADSVDKVSSGSRLAGQAGTTMEAVVRSFQQVAALVEEISAICNQQRHGIQTTGQAVEQINRVTQQNAELVGEVDHAASSLEQQASGLTRAVGVFRLNGATPSR